MHNETNDMKHAFKLTEILLHPFLVCFFYIVKYTQTNRKFKSLSSVIGILSCSIFRWAVE